ncbi:MAG: DUF6542 domain-containing protein [Actinomycetes bacterium]
MSNVEPGAILRSPAQTPRPQIVVTDSEASVLSWGSTARSSATVPGEPDGPPTPANHENPANEPVGFPWEGSENAPQPGVAIGPSVRTERLYRSVSVPDSYDPQAPPSTTAGPTSSQAATSGVYPDDLQGTMVSMSALSADAKNPAGIPAASSPSPAARASSDRGISGFVAFLIIAAVTGIAGYFDMLANRQFSWIAGTAFVCTSFVVALLVRRSDLWTAVIAPPLAFLTALIIAGQPSTLTSAGSLMIREISLVATGLAFNAPFIFGGTIAALIVVLIRRATSRSKA